MIDILLLGGIIAFLIGFYSMPKIIKAANEKKLYDIPNDRKIHKTPIPSLGGIGIFIGFITSFLFFGAVSNKNVDVRPFYILAFLLVFFFGAKDDVLGLSPLKKFAGQIVVATLLVFKADLAITNMHGFLGINAIQGMFSYFFTVFTIVVVMNAYNLIDGVDGLAGTITVITTLAFSVYFTIIGDTFFALMGYSFVGAILSFLIFNLHPAKIFMGDTGSMMCGLVNAILCIHFIEVASTTPILTIYPSPAMAFGILIMPLLDTLRVFAIRIANGRSPFFPDRNHLHHMLLDKGFGHSAIAVLTSCVAVLFIAFSYFSLPLGTTWLILAQSALYFGGVLAIQLTPNLKSSKSKVVSINEDTDLTFGKRFKNAVNIVNSKNQKSYHN